ncbi:protein of unknown function [Spirosomataceae bacterium TFI 002]|nr:protein of unknown function [Spirosomataceae bacterium TFI 002]
MKKIFILPLLAFAACTTPTETETEVIDHSTAIKEKVDALSDVLINPSMEKIDALVLEELTYGHSSGKIETKAEFADALLNGQDDIIAWNVIDENMKVVDNTAWFRHVLEGEVVRGVDTSDVNLKVMMVWVNTDSGWKLLARQAVK